jgi:predicted Ser/Thr protein kinase
VTPEQWTRVKDLFQQALDQPAGVRREWIAQAAANDELRREVDALLQAHDTAGDFLERPPDVDPADLHLFPPGTHLGPYEILDELGRGGAGIVYLAQDHRLGRRVALKLVAAGAEPEFRDRLRREARAAATITHPSVATIHALEEFDDQLFIVSEYVRGETLRTALAGGALRPERALAIARGIAAGLRAAHEAGVVHRDLKPENVLLPESGGVKVVDFGIARIDHAGVTQITRHGALLGTPAYMAPEQLLGTAADARADIFAFGIVLSEMVSGRHPGSPGPLPVTRRAPASGPAGDLSAIAQRCMQVDPSARYQTAAALLAALDQVADGTRAGADGARWWWEFHQAAATLAYTITIWPAWQARGVIGGPVGRGFFIALLAAVVLTGTLRLHRWFTSRFYPRELDWVRQRSVRWIAAGDALFVLALVSAALLIRGEDSSLDLALVAIAIGAAVSALVIEPATARAAFPRDGTHHGV